MSTNHKSDKGTGISRRETMRRGLYGAAGLMLADGGGSRALAADEPKKKAPKAKAKSVIQIFLWGGMSHNDTWDPKPETGREYMGDFIRGARHQRGAGSRLGGSVSRVGQAGRQVLAHPQHDPRRERPRDGGLPDADGTRSGERLAYPSVGAVFALFKRPTKEYKGLIPPYVVLTKPQGRFSEEGFLGPKYKPFATGGDPNAERFAVEGVVARGHHRRAPEGSTRIARQDRHAGQPWHAASPQVAAAEGGQGAGLRIDPRAPAKRSSTCPKRSDAERYEIATAATRSASRAWWHDGWSSGRALRGDQLPRRLGHAQRALHQSCGGSLPELDQGVATLLQDLDQRSRLLKSTSSGAAASSAADPRSTGNRPGTAAGGTTASVFSALVAGGGFRGGAVVGSSSEKAEVVKDRPVYPVDLLGSIYQLAGIDPNAKLPHPLGLDAHVLPPLSDKVKSGGLLSEIM